MWLMKRGRRLHECSQWFHAFDFDQDEMVGVADFLQGLVSTSCPGSPLPGPASLSTALFLFRLLDLEGNHGSQKLESILKEQASEAQVAQLMQQATVFNQSILHRTLHTHCQLVTHCRDRLAISISSARR